MIKKQNSEVIGKKELKINIEHSESNLKRPIKNNKTVGDSK
jgi:hypothetical protein